MSSKEVINNNFTTSMKILSKLLLTGTLLVLTTATMPRFGIHRVKQGRWNYNSDGDNTQLVLFASFAGGLSNGGYLKISFNADADFGDSLYFSSFLLSGSTDIPATFDSTSSCTNIDYDYYCQVSSGFDKGGSYGLVFWSSTSGLSTGVMSGPIGLQTRLNNDGDSHGPVIDSNPSFDVMFLKPEAPTLSWAFSA